MAEETPKFDPKLEEGIAYFEKMLQVMPEDRTTLEFLCVAYGQIGEPVKQRKALISLAGVLLKEKDLESADSIAERLAQYREPDAQAAVLRIRAAHGMGLGPAIADPQPKTQGATDDQPSSGNPQTAALHIAIKAEKELIQTLALRKILDESTADEALHRLAELSGMSGCFLVSALSVLEKENSGFGEMAMAAVADEAGAPPIPLEAFDISSERLQLLPESIVRVRGVLPFAKLGDTLLVATLNPLDAALKHQVEGSVGCPCRFYLAHPRTMEELLDKLFAEIPAEQEAEGRQEGS
jgi:hypothetical protein